MINSEHTNGASRGTNENGSGLRIRMYRVGRNFTISIEDGSNYNPKTLPELLARTHERLLNVQLECLPYEQILQKCDRPSTFFYLDLPYFGKPYYKFNMVEKDYVEMADRL